MAATVIDNTDAGFTNTGGWTPSNGGTGFLGADYLYAASGSGSEVATWPFTGLTGGVPVFLGASYAPDGNRATNATYKIYDSDGTTVLGTVVVDQTATAGNFTAAKPYYYFGSFTPTGTSLTVKLTNAANGYVIADSIWLDTSPPNPLFIVTLAAGEINDGSKWQGGAAPSGSVYGRGFHAMTLHSDYIVGDGTDNVVLDFSDPAASLTISATSNDVTFTLKGHLQLSSDSYNSGIRTWLRGESSGAHKGTFRFDGNSGVQPKVLLGRQAKVEFDGVSDSNRFRIETKSGSAGNKGLFTPISVSTVEYGNAAIQYAEFYRMDGFGSSLSSSGNSFTMQHCFVDIATCRQCPSVSISADGTTFSATDNQFGNFNDAPIADFGANSYYVTFFPASGLAKTSGTRELKRNLFHGNQMWSWYLSNSGMTITDNVMACAFYDNHTSTGAVDFSNNFNYAQTQIGVLAEGSVCISSSHDNYWVSGPNSPGGIMYQGAGNHSHINETIQNDTAGVALGMGSPNDVGSGTKTWSGCLGINNLGAGFCLGLEFSNGISNVTTNQYDHCTVNCGSKVADPPINGALLSGGNGTDQFATSGRMTNCLIVADTPAYLAKADTNIGSYAAIDVDVMPAAGLDYNATSFAPLTCPAGTFSGVSGDTGIEDGTPYRSPMSGSTAPGQHDIYGVNPQFVDNSWTWQKYAVAVAGSSGLTDSAKLQDLTDYLWGDPVTRIADLCTKVRSGFKVQNVALKDAGHDGVTIGALGFQAASTINPYSYQVSDLYSDLSPMSL
jgi:hypothetical protein